MRTIDQVKMELTRFRVVLLFILLAFLFLGSQLWRIQIAGADQYRFKLDRQSVRRVRLAATRGRILDRNGVCLADTVPSFCIAAYVEELRQPGKWKHTVDHVDALLSDVSKRIGLPKTLATTNIWLHVTKRLPLPLVAWHDVGDDVVARWMEGVGRDFPGIDVCVEPKRVYPFGTLAAHTLGYVGKSHPDQDPAEPFHYYFPEMEGKSGLELSLNDQLEGVSGGRLLRVDASGINHSVMTEKAPVPGSDVVLTLDVRIQQMVEAELKSYCGACVMMDPNSGEVLAIASAPTFDPNQFSKGIRQEDWDRMISDPERPLTHRAVRGVYPPGSTFKPLVALVALQNHLIDPDQPLECHGAFEKAGTIFHCWSREHGHGSLAMIKAFEQSCNIYFFQVGLLCGYDRIHDEAERVGFGMKTNIPLGSELPGWLPPKTSTWRVGDTCNLSIGQGDLLVTPIQMAVFAAAIANGGTILEPRLTVTAAGDASRMPRQLHWPQSALAVVRRGMYEVVQSETGTGKRARLDHVLMAGKTGTAEYGGTRENHKKYAWMIAYAPYEKPRYVIAIVLEDATAGGLNAAPLVKNIMTGALNLTTKDMATNAIPPEVSGT